MILRIRRTHRTTSINRGRRHCPMQEKPNSTDKARAKKKRCRKAKASGALLSTHIWSKEVNVINFFISKTLPLSCWKCSQILWERISCKCQTNGPIILWCIARAVKTVLLAVKFRWDRTRETTYISWKGLLAYTRKRSVPLGVKHKQKNRNRIKLMYSSFSL